RVLTIVVLFAWSVAAAAAVAQNDSGADAVLLNGVMVTMTRENDVRQALAIRGGKIAAVGTNEEIKALIGSTTKVADLQGKTVLPGFYAAHDHFPSAGRVALFEVDLNSPPMGSIRSMDDIVTALREKAS